MTKRAVISTTDEFLLEIIRHTHEGIPRDAELIKCYAPERAGIICFVLQSEEFDELAEGGIYPQRSLTVKDERVKEFLELMHPAVLVDSKLPE